VAASELAHWLASRRPARPGDGGVDAVIVLGYPTGRGGRLHPVQRWRAAIGARTVARSPGAVVVFTGGPTRRAEQSEAEVIARYAVDVLGLPESRVKVEPRATTTWENVAFSLPFVSGASHIAIASDPLHAARARGYVRRQRPDLAARLVGADDYRLFERWWLKLPSALYQAGLVVLDLRGAERTRTWSKKT